jgi:hypothetical protein
MHEYVHFLEEVLSVFEERNRSTTGKPKRYIGKVSFDSTILDDQAAINYTGPPGQRVRAVKRTEEEKLQSTVELTTTPTLPVAILLPSNPAR